ncbi:MULTISPECIES: hypothetical protein [unclassified Paenibacillus]|uniref:hypothetical protein n=1 Tax=unclassified Paenibacillus TaxID=185978 RepID=UPI002405FA38|nr:MULTISPECIES: hypothetical protein [unclassified Paenibacillus]MDF9844047.1 hypothetical protein [Paenibacillus sp. PastF-2]MDF9850652.1 hypothetical protein [Paenibacillus sp. PastM-2]MDF9857197.1 hypothetical protein [Paenibacillus sp. PastF-1]MDH6482502.1 hypothetical protein [Paenibacillus sp. PastH-2]MDH6509895.1 hypothetical protein [Paenibacillus sp. PastM-3]
MRLNKVFTIFLVSFQLWFLYATPISSISVADAILILMYPVLLFKLIKEKKMYLSKNNLPLVLFLVYIFFQFILVFSINDISFVNEAALRTGRYVLYLITVIFIAPNFFEVKLGIKVLKYICIASTIFLFFQILMVRFAGVYIPGTIPGLPLIRLDLLEFNQNIMNAGYLIRPRSFFSEPAHYATYVLLYLGIGLFSEKKKIIDYFPEIIITFGLLVSNSATGFIACAIVWGVWAFKKLLLNEKKTKFIIATLLLTPFLLFLIVNTEYYQTFVFRVFGEGSGGLGTAAASRMENYDLAFSTDGLSTIEILFGHGMVDTAYYMPSIPTIFFYFGIIGMLVFFIFSLMIMHNGNEKQKIIIILTIVLSIGGDAIFGPNCLYFYLFLLSPKTTKKLE